MLNKEEYIEKKVRDILNGEMKLEDFVKEHFELIEEHKKVQLEAHKYFVELCGGGWDIEEYHEFKNPQPYKFEELYTDMQVWDDSLRECIIIGIIYVEHILNHTIPFYSWGQEDLEVVEFKEGRFFPITKALQYQGKED